MDAATYVLWLNDMLKPRIVPSHLRIGSQGEDIAEKFLRGLGYHIRDRNIRIGRDEIDLIAFDPDDQVLVFVEVKTRSKNQQDFGPELNMTWKKRQKLRRSARRWVADHEYEEGYRIDLVYVAEWRVINHIKEMAWE